MFTPMEVPPDYQVWADQSYIKIRQHLKDKELEFFEDLQLQWIAAPYFSLWKGKNAKGNLWVLHNDFATQGFSHGQIIHPRQALAFFARCWQQFSLEDMINHLTLYNSTENANSQANLASLGRILESSVEDEEIWEE